MNAKKESEQKRSSKIKLPTAVLGMSDLNDDSSFVAGCMDGTYLVQLKDGSFEKLDEHASYVSSVATGNEVAISAGYDGAIQWYDLSARKRIRRIDLHQFWSWDMDLSPDGQLVASVTGQYLAGGYKYEPAAEREPSVKIVSVESGETVHQFSHVPSVQSVAFSPDNGFVAAGNLMGEIRVWDLNRGEMVANWTTPDFTSWGIIKSHCYLGGVFALKFTHEGEHLLMAGMGPMRDPMAGNGRQLWQKWSWRNGEPKMIDQTHQGESGEGLMESLAITPDGQRFAMGGRLRGGDWNVALFEMKTGNRLNTWKTGFRVTDMRFHSDGRRLVIAGTQGQPKDKKDGEYPPFGRVEEHEIS